MPSDLLENEGSSQNTVELSLYEVRRKIYPRSVSGVFIYPNPFLWIALGAVE